MHFKDDPISDMHAKNCLIISCLKQFPGPTKFGPVFWSRLFRRGPVEYNYPVLGFTRNTGKSVKRSVESYQLKKTKHLSLNGNIFQKQKG